MPPDSPEKDPTPIGAVEEPSANEDVSLVAGPNADPLSDLETYVRREIRSRYEVYSYRHAAALLSTSFKKEFGELQDALALFGITTEEIAKQGGNESLIPKKLSAFLRPKQWIETRVQGDLSVRLKRTFEKTSEKVAGEETRNLIKYENYIDGHKIDYVKGRVAFDVEWNSKDQTFDRDLYAFRAFHECGVISVAVLLTRSASMNQIFEVLPHLDKDGKVSRDKKGNAVPVLKKYGASTTWMGKLLYRLNAGRHGACPILVIGITPRVVTDWATHKLNSKHK
jgi:hypothetical protein